MATIKGTTNKLGGFLGYLKSPEFIAVGAAIIVTPIVAGYLLPLLGRIPFIGTRPVFTLIAAAVIMFLLAKWVKGTYAKAVMIGIAGGFSINAFVSSSIGQRVIGRISASAQAGLA